MNTAVVSEALTSSAETGELHGAAELPLGTCIHGKYTVLGVLGKGGFATVYDAVHLGLQRAVAIKVLHVEAHTPVSLIERFHREARISALVRHPNVLEVYDTGALPDGSPFLVMERMSGETLSAAIDRGALPIAMVVETGCQLLRGLVAISEAGIVHRDVKPENIMLDHPVDGPPVIKLVDFGVSRQLTLESSPRLTCDGTLIGTPQYMSPEQIRGEDVDVRSDLYAVGAVLYEALTGHAPHESANFSELVVAVLNNPITPPRERRPNCPPELEQLVLCALSADPEQRFGSPHAMLAALDAVADRFALPRGVEAFGASDGPHLNAGARGVGARDAASLIRKVWPRSIGAPRSLQLALLALLVMGARGAPLPERGGLGEGVVAATSAPDSVAASAGAASPASAQRDSLAGAAPQRLPPLVTKPATLPPSTEADPATSSTLNAAGPTPQVSELAQSPESAQGGAAAVASAAPVAEKAELAGASPAGAGVGPGPRGASEQAKAGGAAPTAPAVAATTMNQARRSGAPAQEPPLGDSDASNARRATAAPSERSRGNWDDVMQAALAELVRGSLQQAQAHYQQAARIDPSAPAAFRGLGLVAARRGDAQTARKALARYLELAPRAHDAQAIAKRLASLR